MNEIIKRKKDEGFTLIELMIVIAVIGILAIVLVPKVGTIKTQAKSAGIDTNVRMVQGYVQSRITYWNDHASANTVIARDIANAFKSGTETMKNPLSTNSNLGVDVKDTFNGGIAETDDALQIVGVGSHTTIGHGSVEVEVPTVVSSSAGIIVNGLSQTGSIYSTVTILP